MEEVEAAGAAGKEGRELVVTEETDSRAGERPWWDASGSLSPSPEATVLRTGSRIRQAGASVLAHHLLAV